jgi:FtsH-binding integral membrane protein
MAFETERRPLGGYDGALGRTDAAPIDVGLRQYMLRVYNYMASGLLLSGLVAYFVANSALSSAFFRVTETGRLAGYTGLGWVAILAPIGLLFAMSYAARNGKNGLLQGLYWGFVALMGVGLSNILLMYTGVSVVRVLLVTAISFGGLSLYGYTTKRDLSPMRTFLMMGLIGIIVASIVSIFWASTMLQFVISVAGVLIFAGLTAYDTQTIKNQYFEVQGSSVENASAIMGATSLYLDFINLFQFLMMFLGQRRE